MYTCRDDDGKFVVLFVTASQSLSQLELVELGEDAVFRPPKEKANVSVRDHDFLGKAKVSYKLYIYI